MGEQRIGLFVCGVQKGGTTSMDGYLRQHPQLSPPYVKELHLFDDEERDWHKPLDVEGYFAAADDRLRYDCTPIYGFWPQALARIHAYNPAARLIFLYRDPFARAWSQWCMEYARGAESLSFAEAIRSGRQRLAGLPANAPQARVYSYVERGFYGAQLARARALFAPEQMLLLRSADLARDHSAVLARVCAFLGIGDFGVSAARRDHGRTDVAYPGWPTAADRALVRTELAADQAEFTRLSGLVLEEEAMADWG